MRKLLLAWAAWRLARILVRIAVAVAIAGLAASETIDGPHSPHTVSRIERALRPTERDLQHALENGLRP